MLQVIGLDCSSKNLGFAVRNDNKIIDYGTIKTPRNTKDIKYTVLGRTEIIRHGFADVIARRYLLAKFNFIVIERSFVGGSGDITRALCETQGVIKNMLYQRYRPRVIFVEPTSSAWRMRIFGTGKADKKDAIEYAKALGYKPDSEHSAEAICIALALDDKLLHVCDMSNHIPYYLQNYTESFGGGDNNIQHWDFF